MSIDLKIHSIKGEIHKEYVSQFEDKLKEVLSFTESKPEALFLLQLLDYSLKRFRGDIMIPSDGIEFLENDLGYPLTNEEEYKIAKYNYRFDGIDCFSKYYGFKFNTGYGGDRPGGDVYGEIEFYPQHEVLINNKKYRLDIAIFLITKYYQTDEIYITKKIAIECDGYDYHKQPKKFKEDKIRERALKANGWKEVLRYSGSEIYEIGDDQNKIKHNFEEILDVFWI